MVKGAFWAAAAQPLILSFGTILAALNTEILDVQPIFELKNLLPFLNKQDEQDKKDI